MYVGTDVRLQFHFMLQDALMSLDGKDTNLTNMERKTRYRLCPKSLLLSSTLLQLHLIMSISYTKAMKYFLFMSKINNPVYTSITYSQVVILMLAHHTLYTACRFFLKFRMG